MPEIKQLMVEFIHKQVMMNINDKVLSLLSEVSSYSDFDLLDTNVTLSNLDPIPQSIGAITLSSSFALFFIILMIFISSAFIRPKIRKEMKRNQIILIGMVFILSIVQCIGIVGRNIYDILAIIINNQYQTFVQNNYSSESQEFIDTFEYHNCSLTTTQVGVKFSNIVAMHLMGSVEVLFIVGNLITMVVIMSFVGNVFIETVKRAGSFEEANSVLTKWLMITQNSFTTFFCISFGSITLATAVVYFFIKIHFMEDFQFILFLIAYIIYFCQIVINLIISIIVAFKVLQTIRMRSALSNKHKSQKPVVKVITLQIALVFSALSQIIAMACAIGMDAWSYMTLFYNFINSAGILIFGIVTVLLYQPIFSDSAEVVKELNQQQSETTSSRKKSLFKRVQSPEVSNV